MPQPTTSAYLASFRKQHLNVEFLSLRAAKLEGIFVSTTPGDASLWVGVIFVRRGKQKLMRCQTTKFASQCIHSWQVHMPLRSYDSRYHSRPTILLCRLSWPFPPMCFIHYWHHWRRTLIQRGVWTPIPSALPTMRGCRQVVSVYDMVSRTGSDEHEDPHPALVKSADLP